MRRLLRNRTFRLFLFLFVAFGLFTTFVPCKYSSASAVGKRLGLVAQASGEAEGVDCNCNRGWSSAYCSVDSGCTTTSWGCGPFWYFTCNAWETPENWIPINQ